MDWQLHADLRTRFELVVHKFENFRRLAKALGNELATEVATESIAEMRAVAKRAGIPIGLDNQSADALDNLDSRSN